MRPGDSYGTLSLLSDSSILKIQFLLFFFFLLPNNFFPSPFHCKQRLPTDTPSDHTSHVLTCHYLLQEHQQYKHSGQGWCLWKGTLTWCPSGKHSSPSFCLPQQINPWPATPRGLWGEAESPPGNPELLWRRWQLGRAVGSGLCCVSSWCQPPPPLNVWVVTVSETTALQMNRQSTESTEQHFIPGRNPDNHPRQGYSHFTE